MPGLGNFFFRELDSQTQTQYLEQMFAERNVSFFACCIGELEDNIKVIKFIKAIKVFKVSRITKKMEIVGSIRYGCIQSYACAGRP